jgi:hypothetical protein
MPGRNPDKRHRRHPRDAYYHKRGELREANEALTKLVEDTIKERDFWRKKAQELALMIEEIKADRLGKT